MPRIPTQTREVKPTSEVGAVKVNPAAMTQATQAAGQFGQAMSDVGNEFVQRLREAREATEFSTAQRIYEEGINAGMDNLQRSGDYKTFGETYQTFNQGAYENAVKGLTEQNAKNAFEGWYQKQKTDNDKTVNNLVWKLESKNLAAQYYMNLEHAVKEGDVDRINSLTSGAVKGNIIDAVVGEKAREGAVQKIQYNTLWKTAINMPDETSGMKVIEEAEDILPDTRNSLWASVKRHFMAKEAQQKEAIEKQREQVRLTLLPKLRDGSISSNDIYNAGFEAKEEKLWFDWMDTRNFAIARGKANPLLDTNDAIYGNMSERVNRFPDTVKKADIWDLHGKGLSTDNCEALTRRLETNKTDTEKAQALKRAHSSLKSLKNDGFFGEGPEGENVWGQKANALDQFVENNPDATNHDITAYLEELTGDEKSGWVAGILNRFWEGLTFQTYSSVKEELNEGVNKIVGYKDGKPVYELPDGKWQVGD